MGKNNYPAGMDDASFRRSCVLPLCVVRMQAVLALLFLVPIGMTTAERRSSSGSPTISSSSSFASKSKNHHRRRPFRLYKRDRSGADWEDCDLLPEGYRFFGFGREFSLFESPPRGGGARNSYANNPGYAEKSDTTDDDDNDNVYSEEEDDYDEDDFFTRMEHYRQRRKPISSVSSGGYYSNNNNNNEGYSFSRAGRPPYKSARRQKKQRQGPRVLRNAQNWWMTQVDPKLQSLPKIVCRIEPTTTLKLRKTFRPLKTIIRIGADYNTQQGIWQFKSSWEDAIIGGKITLSGSKELQLTKSWQMSVGGVEDLVTRLRFRATINLQTFQAYARVGFRTERLTPIDVVEGFTILKRLPLDGSGGNLKLEVKANVALPEPEIEYRTESQARSVTGMGDIEVSIDEMNLLLDY